MVLLVLTLIIINGLITLTPSHAAASLFFSPTAGRDAPRPPRTQKLSQILPPDLLVGAISTVEDVENF